MGGGGIYVFLVENNLNLSENMRIKRKAIFSFQLHDNSILYMQT